MDASNDDHERTGGAGADWDAEIDGPPNPPLPDGGPRDGVHESDDELVPPGAEYGEGTHVGSGDRVPEHTAAEPSESDPDALVDGQRVGDGQELAEGSAEADERL